MRFLWGKITASSNPFLLTEVGSCANRPELVGGPGQMA